MKTLNDNANNAGHAAASAGGPGRRWLMAAALAVAAAAAGASFANGTGLPGHHGHAALMEMSPAAMDAHIDKMVGQFAPDASPDQKARLTAICKAALSDLRPAHAQMRQAHARAQELLTSPVIDRAELERLRAGQMQRMDTISRRMLAAMEDAADVLTPQQRAKFVEHLSSHMP
jgi:protein CpxP